MIRETVLDITSLTREGEKVSSHTAREMGGEEKKNKEDRLSSDQWKIEKKLKRSLQLLEEATISNL